MRAAELKFGPTASREGRGISSYSLFPIPYSLFSILYFLFHPSTP
jgi:hypothetical protein